MFSKFNALTFFFVFLAATLSAQILEPVKWDSKAVHVKDDLYDLIITANIEDGWTVYSQYLEGEDGPVPTTFAFTEGDHYSLQGKVEESGNRKEGYDKVFQMNVVKFSKKAIFTQRIKANDASKPVVGYLEFMTCDDEKCLPPEYVDFSIKLPAGAAKAVTPTPEPTQGASASTDEQIDISTSSPATPQTAPVTQDKVELVPNEQPATETAPAKVENSGGTSLLDINSDELLEPVKWSTDFKKIDDQTYDLIFTAKIDDGWYLYTQKKYEDGPNPTHFDFKEGAGYTLDGPAKEEGDIQTKFDSNFGIKISKFMSSPAVFRQRVKVSDPNQAITGELEFTTCDDKQCLPPTYVPFSFALTADAANNLPITTPTTNTAGLDQRIATIQETYPKPLGDCGEEEVTRNDGLLKTFFFGFLGGLLALLTPCVFPMIPLTVAFFTKGSKDRASGIRNALIYGLSIIGIYVAIGMLVTGIFGPTALNELSTNWIANVLFFVIFVVFAISFFGFFEITLPSSLATKSDQMAGRGGLLGIFFMAATLAIVSFSCTGPIIGSALVQAATNKLGPLVVMLGFSSALALPFGLFAAFPAWLQSLPKSGGWMNSVKVLLGFLELALALKFLSIADMVMGWGILPYEIFMAAWVIIAICMALYIFRIISFPHDSKKKERLSPLRLVLGTAFVGIAAYLALGFGYNKELNTYNARKAMSGLAPPAQYNIFLPESKVDPAIKAKYPSFSKCANNLDCFKDYHEGMAYAKEQNMPVLVDFTGHGCVNCRKTEEHIWIADEVWKRIQNDYVLISLYVDDRKPLDKPLFSSIQEKPLRNVGNLWADFQIVNFQQNSQPLYVMMTPEQQVMAAPRGYKEGIKSYQEFLDCGLSTFNRLSSRE